MRIFLLAAFSIFAFNLQAQFGASAYYNVNSIRPSFTTQTGDENFLGLENGYEAAVHYWFRLKNQRVEFYPTLYYASAPTELSSSTWTEYGFQFKTNIYVFDFAEDCDCPTFGKQGPALEKGFFLQITPGYARYDFVPIFLRPREASGGFTIGGGVGLDIGISNLLTLTPFAGVRYGLGPLTEINLSDNPPSTNIVEPKLTTIQLGLSATFRLDKKRY